MVAVFGSEGGYEVCPLGPLQFQLCKEPTRPVRTPKLLRVALKSSSTLLCHGPAPDISYVVCSCLQPQHRWFRSSSLSSESWNPNRPDALCARCPLKVYVITCHHEIISTVSGLSFARAIQTTTTLSPKLGHP